MPLMLAVPQDVPAGQLNGDWFGPPTGSTYVASYANVPAVAGAAATSAATAGARAIPTFRISITPLAPKPPHAIPPLTLRHHAPSGNPNNLGSFVPFVTGVCLAAWRQRGSGIGV